MHHKAERGIFGGHDPRVEHEPAETVAQTTTGRVSQELHASVDVHEWRDADGVRYRLVMRVDGLGQQQLVTEYCAFDNLGMDSWRVLDVPDDTCAGCEAQHKVIRALEIARDRVSACDVRLSRLTLGSPLH